MSSRSLEVSRANGSVLEADDDVFVEARIQVGRQQHQQPVCQVTMWMMMMMMMGESCESTADVTVEALSL